MIIPPHEQVIKSEIMLWNKVSYACTLCYNISILLLWYLIVLCHLLNIIFLSGWCKKQQTRYTVLHEEIPRYWNITHIRCVGMLCLNITRSDGSFKHKMSLHRKKLNVIITDRNEVVAKVMFVLVSVILLMGGRGGVLSQHALQVVSQHTLQQVSRGHAIPACIAGGIPACLAAGLQRGASSWGVPGLGGCLVLGVCRGGLCGLLLWPSVIVFCFALLLWPSGVAFWYGLLVWCPSDCRRPSGWKWSSVMAFWCDLLLFSGMALWYGLLVRPSGTGVS